MDTKHISILMEVVDLFVQKDRRGRFVELLTKPKRYNDGLWDLLHDPRYFEPENIIKIPSMERTPELIYDRLKKLGFQNQCFVISTDWEIDGKVLPTMKALKVSGDQDTLLFCTVSKIGYYEGHEGWCYILRSSKSK